MRPRTAPRGLEPGSPFGQSIAALVVYLHYAHAIGLERLAALMGEMFASPISEGAISNMLAATCWPARVSRLLAAAAAIRDTVTASPVVCSDETSARVSGKTWWEWVFIGTLAVLHVIRPSRGKAVVTRRCSGPFSRWSGSPICWAASAATRVQWQVCLAHLLRDARYAVECGDTAFSAPFKRLLLRAIAIGRRREGLKDTHAEAISGRPGSPARSDHGGCPDWASRAASCASASPPTGRICSCSSPTAMCPYTNNVSERHLRPSVIFRKVTNGFRCEWGAETYAAFRSVVSTAKANRASVLDVLRFVLTAHYPCSRSPRWGEQLPIMGPTHISDALP